jgi:hypothetical protein
VDMVFSHLRYALAARGNRRASGRPRDNATVTNRAAP